MSTVKKEAALKQVKLNVSTDKKLTKLSKKRKKNDELNSSKQAIIQELVFDKFKEEIG